MEDEIYKELPYSKKIYVSNYGNIKKIDKNGEIKYIKKYLMGPKNHQEVVFSAPYYGTTGYAPKLQLAYVVAFLFLNNVVDYRYVRVAYRDGDPKNCAASNLYLYETDLPLTVQFIKGCILPETISQYKNTVKKQYQKRKEKQTKTNKNT